MEISSLELGSRQTFWHRWKALGLSFLKQLGHFGWKCSGFELWPVDRGSVNSPFWALIYNFNRLKVKNSDPIQWCNPAAMSKHRRIYGQNYIRKWDMKWEEQTYHLNPSGQLCCSRCIWFWQTPHILLRETKFLACRKVIIWSLSFPNKVPPQSRMKFLRAAMLTHNVKWFEWLLLSNDCRNYESSCLGTFRGTILKMARQ